MSLAAVIPTLNEAERIGATVDAAFAAGAGEVIVSDGGSSDRTLEIAAARGAIVLSGYPTRAAQLNAGGERARGDHLVFVHADTELPVGAAAAIASALERGALFGGFKLRFAEPALKLKVAAALINARTAITLQPWGDQAQFLARDTFVRTGGFRTMPIMEDYELAVRMRALGRTVVLGEKVTTSGRRFLEKGVLRTAIINWRIVAAYRANADPDALARMYRG